MKRKNVLFEAFRLKYLLLTDAVWMKKPKPQRFRKLSQIRTLYITVLSFHSIKSDWIPSTIKLFFIVVMYTHSICCYNYYLKIAVVVLVVVLVSRVWLCETPWTVAHEAPLSMGFSRQEYWSRLPFPSQVTSQSRDQTQVSCTAGRFFTTWTTGKPSFKNNR